MPTERPYKPIATLLLKVMLEDEVLYAARLRITNHNFPQPLPFLTVLKNLWEVEVFMPTMMAYKLQL